LRLENRFGRTSIFVEFENGTTRVGRLFVETSNTGEVKLGSEGKTEIIAMISMIMRMSATLGRIHLLNLRREKNALSEKM
jgi:hypothetical protein